jgi:dipeptidyl-peptidase-4
MRIRRPAVALALLAALGAAVEVEGAKRLTLERLYVLPRVIGTSPRSVVWSGDSQRVAFLWNDEGTNFLDVWTAEVANPKPVRITQMPRLQPVAGSSEEAIEKSLQAERDRGVQAVVWYPDGRSLLFVFRGDLYRVEPGSSPQRLTETPAAESEPRFSPNGTLAFLRGGDLFLMDSAGIRQLTRRAQPSVAIESFRWSPDGKRLAFVETDRRAVPLRKIPDYLRTETDVNAIHRALPGEESESRRLAVVEASGGKPRLLDRGGSPLDPLFSYEWSPASRALLVDTSDLYVKDRRLLSIDTESGRFTEIYREVNPSNVTAQWSASWAPDGKGTVFVSDRDEDYHLCYLAGPGETPRRLTRGSWAVAEFEVRPNGIFFVANAGRPEERHLFRVPLEGGEPVKLTLRPGTHTPFVSPDGRWAALHFSSDESPPDLLLTETAGAAAKSEVQVTRSPLPEFAEYTWAKPEYVTFKSQVDGATLHGRLTLPPDLDRSKKYPAILGSVYSNTVRNQWGGRTAHPTWGLDQYLVQERYVLLNVNIRGSWGHGKAFRQGIRLDYGGIDTEDLYAGVRYLESLGFVDMKRVGIWGSSYGGLLTCMSLFKKPGVYRAGVAGAPATNVFHATTGEMRVMMRPQDQAKEYEKASAYTFAEGLQDHLMIIHGMRDSIVLFKDSVVLVERLIRLGKDVDFVVLPDSQHGWDTEGLSQTLFAFRKLVGHFDRHLGRGPR